MEINILYFQWHLLVSALFILASISLLIYYHSKEISFLYYSLYSFSLLAYLVIKIPYNDFAISNALNSSRYAPLNWYVQIWYYVLYSFFILHFLNIAKFYPSLYKNVKRALNVLLTLFSFLFICCVLLDNKALYTVLFLYVFAPCMIFLTVYTVYTVRKIEGKLKHFVIIGILIYLFFVLISLTLTITKTYASFALFFFYIGAFIEQFIFSFGLAYKVKLINESRNAQYEENKRIKANQYQILQEELKKKENELLEIRAKAENERLEKLRHEFMGRIQRLRLDSLQNQMNPHFIFNVLNSIKIFLIENDKQNAVYYLNKLSKLIRKVLEGSRVNYHSLKEELEILKIYLSIENIRFDNRIKITYDLTTEPNLLDALKIPPLILQPFAENALWHGLTSSQKEKKNLTIKTFVGNGFFKLTITDNGIGRERSLQFKKNKHFKKESIGIKLSQERLDYFNQDKNLNYHFYFTDLKKSNNEALGTKVTFVFDLPKA